MKKINSLILILALILIIPQIVLAAWWNPFSWGIWSQIFHRQIPQSQTTQYSCNNNSDCVSQCAKGCVNNSWAQKNPDNSECLRAWSCSCVSNTCYTDGNPPKNKNTQNLVGGDKDVHGCIGSAGYSWCETKQKCLRPWEEKCKIDKPISLLPKNYEECKNAILQTDKNFRTWPLCEYSVAIDKPAYNECVTIGGEKRPAACMTCPGCPCLSAQCSLSYVAPGFVLPEDYSSCVGMPGGAYGGGGDSGGVFCSIYIPKPKEYNATTMAGIYNDCISRGGKASNNSCYLKIYKK